MKISQFVRKRVAAWLGRYLPAEIFGTVGAILAATAIRFSIFPNLLAAEAGTWGENFGFYGTMFCKTFSERTERRPLQRLAATLKSLLLEFGPAEVVDTGFMRPACMYLGIVVLDGTELGVFAGKILADFFFYLLVIPCFELSRIRK